MAPLYTEGQVLLWTRMNTVVTIIRVIAKPKTLQGQAIDEALQLYMIENVNGTLPSASMIQKLNLDVTKKYVFVNETELSII